MNLSDVLMRSPAIIAAIAGMIVSLMMIRRHPFPAGFALAACGIDLLLSLFGGSIFLVVNDMTGNVELSRKLSPMIISSVRAIQLTMVLLAVYGARRSLTHRIEVPQDQVQFALSQVTAGQSYDQIETNLSQRGLPAPIVGLVMNEVEAQAAKAVHIAGVRNLIIGFCLFGLGLVITIGSLALAINTGGGKYVITQGPILIGAVMIVRGLVQITK